MVVEGNRTQAVRVTMRAAPADLRQRLWLSDEQQRSKSREPWYVTPRPSYRVFPLEIPKTQTVYRRPSVAGHLRVIQVAYLRVLTIRTPSRKPC